MKQSFSELRLDNLKTEIIFFCRYIIFCMPFENVGNKIIKSYLDISGQKSTYRAWFGSWNVFFLCQRSSLLIIKMLNNYWILSRIIISLSKLCIITSSDINYWQKRCRNGRITANFQNKLFTPNDVFTFLCTIHSHCWVSVTGEEMAL